MTLEYTQIADDIISVPLSANPNRSALAKALRKTAHIIEVVEGTQTLVIQYDCLAISSTEIISTFETNLKAKHAVDAHVSKVLIIPVIYSEEAGPDLKHVCEALGVSQTEFVDIHTQQTYTIEMIGFTPGFAYVGGAPFNLPRLKQPRIRVNAGSIGLAGGYTGLYALEGPGGWPIVGQTSKKLFDPDRTNPFILAPQMQVKFEAVAS